MWSLKNFTSNASTKPLYVDVPDSQFTSNISGDFAFGGLSDLIVLNLHLYSMKRDDSTAEKLPLSTYLIPQAVVEWESGLRKKR